MKILIFLFALLSFSGTIASIAATVQAGRSPAKPSRSTILAPREVVAPKPIRVILASPY